LHDALPISLKNKKQNYTEIFAHRGFKAVAPENTMPAFQKAIEAGADGIEIDLHFSRDNELIIIHDEFVDRTTNATGLVKNYTLKELKKLDAGSWFSPEFKNTRIPTFKELLAYLSSIKYKGQLLIEIKTDHIKYQGIEEAILKTISEYRPHTFSIIYQSFNPQSIQIVKKLKPDARTAILTYTISPFNWYQYFRHNIEAIHPDKRILFNRAFFFNESKANIKPWVVNSKIELTKIFKRGLRGVITNDVAKAVEIRNEIQNG
ncbi:MAG: glycerophosphodiester phosphodiesterase, partial [Lactobacillaceae bacterium]|nr:glycerophosphodiester phosphodiesterase [Lactobacillaceae bacterium]